MTIEPEPVPPEPVWTVSETVLDIEQILEITPNQVSVVIDVSSTGKSGEAFLSFP